MFTRTDYERRIRSALEDLRRDSAKPFDAAAYGRAFKASAQAKAKQVIEDLRNHRNPFREMQPVFVSLGGADGEELSYLLSNTTATAGILIEQSRELANVARHRTLPTNKKIQVFEGDATTKIAEAIAHARQLVRANHGYVVVTCHAVIHELFDRTTQGFHPLTFFSTIFGEDSSLPTWFLYREPGAPEKWPDEVLVSADCEPSLLKALADEIRKRHPSLRVLNPPPQVTGDHVNLHKNLAMELILKLFYLDDLQYELQERSTSVDHSQMENYLLLAIGGIARAERRGAVGSASFATDSFERLWKDWRIEALGLDQSGKTSLLAIPESQTKVIAWRSPKPVTSEEGATVHVIPGQLAEDQAMTWRALRFKDYQLLDSLLLSKARSWIEREDRRNALELLDAVTRSSSPDSLRHLWAHYLLALASLFSTESSSASVFSGEWEKRAAKFGLDILFLAEHMEFARKAGNLTLALRKGNELSARLGKQRKRGDELPVRRYAVGTSFFVFANLLRAGGLYSAALKNIDKAESWLAPGIESHETELLHCFYARSICGGILRDVHIQAPSKALSNVSEKFALGLIQLTDANAAWFADDLGQAKHHASEAEKTFAAIEAIKYRRRAETILSLFRMWGDLEAGFDPQDLSLSRDLAKSVLFLAGRNDDYSTFSNWFPTVRPSIGAGVLQFRIFASKPRVMQRKIALPKLLLAKGDQKLAWQSYQCKDLDEADIKLREHLKAPRQARIPLWAD